MSKIKNSFLKDVVRRAECIPLRLTSAERELLTILQGALDVSEYTENVDVSQNDFFARSRYDKHVTILAQIDELLATLIGLNATSGDKKSNSMLVCSTRDNAPFFRSCLEVGRRYKIMNPDKMRTTYGKLLYVLMDSVMPKVRSRLEMDLKKPVQTVASSVGTLGLARMLSDPLLEAAAREIVVSKAVAGVGRPQPISSSSSTSSSTSSSSFSASSSTSEYSFSSSETKETKTDKQQREQLKVLSQAKSQAMKTLCEKYSSKEVSKSSVEQIVNSISDHYSFLRDNRGPVERMLQYLRSTFSPEVKNRKYSLKISHGVGGSKLNHSHSTQFMFVNQTLTLWRNIMDRFFDLWLLAEGDLLASHNGYRLANTGQGLQRCQSAPGVARAMADIVSSTRSEVGGWVGLSVVHLGDRDVPNALVFIDKYTQVRRILAPLVSTLDQLDKISEDPGLAKYIKDEFGDEHSLKKEILCDFFKHGFDGSGDDGGSCIDGRLTSCWNWCSKLEKKNYYPVFLLTGFLGFDGDFRS
jgi:hypothetical protein